MSKFKVGDIIKLTHRPNDLPLSSSDNQNMLCLGVVTDVLPDGGIYDITITLFFSGSHVDSGFHTNWGISIEQTQPVLLTVKSPPLHNFKWTSNEDTD